MPGSGKTLFCINLIEKALQTARPVYTNINGLVKEKFTNSHLLHDAPDDWRDCPEGSLVIYDEAQQPHLYPSNAQRGKVEDERLTSMETHRHGGYDLVFVTQAPTFVHHHIRKLVGQHIHFYRAKGVSGAVRYEWSHTCDNPNDRREQERAESTVWRFPKEHFAYYTSAVMHTHKFRIPVKIAVFFAVLLIAASYLIFNIYKNGGLAVLNDSSSNNDSVITQGGESGNGLPPLAPVNQSHTRSTDWRLSGYVTINNPKSIGRPLAIVTGSTGSRLIDFNHCDYDSDRLTVSCVVDGVEVDFHTGFKLKDDKQKQSNLSNPFN